MPSPRLTRRDPMHRPAASCWCCTEEPRPNWPVGGRSASLRRTTAMRDALEPSVRSAGLSLWLLRFGVRGWNAGTSPEPSPCAGRTVGARPGRGGAPGVPAVLLGHSVGARTAMHVADHHSVVGVVGLAPWLEASDPVRRRPGATSSSATAVVTGSPPHG